jgi:hypothetical protein
LPVQMLQGRMQSRCRCCSSTLSGAPAGSDVLNGTQGTLGYGGVPVLNGTQGTLGYGGVPALQGSDCSSVVGYAHSTTLWSTPVQFSGARACCVSTHGAPGVLEYSRRRSTPGDPAAAQSGQGGASAAPHLDAQQKVDSRGVEVLRRDVRDQRRRGSVALDRRELRTYRFSVVPCRFFITAGNALKWFSDTKKTPKRRPRGGRFARNGFFRVHSRAPPRTPTRSARERTSFVAAMRGLACNATREVWLSGREGAFAVHREVTCACPRNGLVRPRCACRSSTAAHAHECADGSGRSGEWCSAEGRAGARAHEQ